MARDEIHISVDDFAAVTIAAPLIAVGPPPLPGSRPTRPFRKVDSAAHKPTVQMRAVDNSLLAATRTGHPARTPKPQRPREEAVDRLIKHMAPVPSEKSEPQSTKSPLSKKDDVTPAIPLARVALQKRLAVEVRRKPPVAFGYGGRIIVQIGASTLKLKNDDAESFGHMLKTNKAAKLGQLLVDLAEGREPT